MKDEILKSALLIAQRDGWQQVTTRRITNEFGYTTSAIYHYLGGKADLLTELQRQGFAQLKMQIQLAADQFSGNPPAQLWAVSEAFWQFAHQNRALYELLFGLAPVSCKGLSGEEMRQAGAKIQQILGELSGGNPGSLFMNWWALASGFVAISFGIDETIKPFVYQAFQEGIKRFKMSL